MNKYSRFHPQDRKIAYFSFEVGLRPEIPTYSGGLGILAGDTLKSFADYGVPAVGVTLLNEKGYFHQEIDEDGNQIEHPVEWSHREYMEVVPEKVTVKLGGRDVLIQAWIYEIEGTEGFKIPVIFLDTNLESNHEEDRKLTSYLYGGDTKYRVKQEIILGMGGVRMLQVLDHDNLSNYHMNEGHSAFLTLELMDRYEGELEKVRDLCVFTTHTPVPAGHDVFDMDLLKEILGDYLNKDQLDHDNIIQDNGLNMTYLALYHSKYVNGVAKKHQEIAQKMYPEYDVEAITNGVHLPTWVSDPFKDLFNKYISSWHRDPHSLRHALSIPDEEIWKAHLNAKKNLIEFVNEHYPIQLDPDVLTIGFARRAAAYKRMDLIFGDKKRLRDIVQKEGDIQLIFGGKAHPRDQAGKDLIRKVHEHIKDLKGDIDIVYLKNYDMYTAKKMVSGTDVWLNTPLPPKEASGTSGMKAAVNGVLNLSVLDGWWIEGHIEDLTGWCIGSGPEKKCKSDRTDAQDLYKKLGENVLPAFYKKPEKWNKMMKYNIALNGSYFNTHRMVAQYVTQAYFQ